MGPAAAIKAVSGKHFSLTVFGFAQVAIDIEPLVRLLRGDNILHGFTHTYVGAVLIGLFAFVAGKPVCEWFLRLWNDAFDHKYLRWLQLTQTITRSGAFIGTFSHVFLDSLMHSDMRPFAPFSSSNPLLHSIPSGWIYLLCAASGFFGMIVIVLVGAWNRWAIEIE